MYSTTPSGTDLWPLLLCDLTLSQHCGIWGMLLFDMGIGHYWSALWMRSRGTVGTGPPSPNLINTLWAENESVIWPTFSTQSLTECNSVLLPVKYQFMSGEGKRASEKQTIKRRKEMEQWDTLLCTAVCEGREGCCVPVGSVGSERWPADTSSSQNSTVHMFSSLTHSPHTEHDLTPTAVSSGAMYL